MKAFIATALVASAAGLQSFYPASHHSHSHLSSSTPQLRLAFPPAQHRHSYRCEIYERAEQFENGGCSMQCVLSGRLGGVSFADSDKRRPHGLCMPAGHSCKIPAEMRPHYNTSSIIGKCTDTCKCVPVTRKELDDRQRNVMFGLGYEYLHNLNEQREIRTATDLRKLPFEISLSPRDKRSSEKCERFEQQNWYWDSRELPANPDDQCKLGCTVQGNFGNVNIKLPERTLSKNKPEGTRCYLRVAETEDIVSFGIKQSVTGKCVQGSCVAEGVRVMHFSHPVVSTTTEVARHGGNHVDVSEENDYDLDD